MITVREFDTGDENLVSQIHNVAFQEWRNKFGHEYGYGPIYHHDVLEWARKLNSHLLVAEHNGEITGYVHLGLKETEGQDIRISEGEIVPTGPSMGQSRLAVLPEYRRMGVATALVERGEELFRSINTDFVVAYACSSNIPGCLLFRKLGFRSEPQYWHEPFSTVVPLYADGVYAELDLDKPIMKPKPNPHISVRDASMEDIEELDRIFGLPWRIIPATRAKEWLTEMEIALVAERKDEIVGAMGCYSNGGLSIPGVVPEHRNKGIGSTLLYHLLIRMKKTHAKAVAYTGLPFSYALKMHWRFGFTEKDRKIHFFKVAG